MAVLQVKSFTIQNLSTTDAAISSAIGVTSTVFSISVIPITESRSRVIVFYN